MSLFHFWLGREYQKRSDSRKRKMEPMPDGAVKVLIVVVLAGTMIWLLVNWLASLMN